MARYIEEFDRKGNFIWFYSFAYDEYELQHVSIGTLMTVESSYLSDYRSEGDTVADALWKLTMEYIFLYFSKVDGVGQRCMLRNAFSM